MNQETKQELEQLLHEAMETVVAEKGKNRILKKRLGSLSATLRTCVGNQ